jgi:hypothetical protein
MVLMKLIGQVLANRGGPAIYMIISHHHLLLHLLLLFLLLLVRYPVGCYATRTDGM